MTVLSRPWTLVPPLSLAMNNFMEEEEDGLDCLSNCSGRGVCNNGSCLCQIQFEGSECKTVNFSYQVAFSSIFFLLALTSLLQLIMCIHAEYLRMKKNPSILRACRITTQKLLYFLVFLASALRGAYFAAPTLSAQWSLSLMSAYYPVVLTGASLIVCFWAEVFHLREIRWDRPRFLSKSFVGFVVFNAITYSLLVAELLLVWLFEDEETQFYSHIFNGCYASLMFIVVIFFLIYGVEVFFKVRGGFTFARVDVDGVISSARGPSNLDVIRRSSAPLLEVMEMKVDGVECNSIAKETCDSLLRSAAVNAVTPARRRPSESQSQLINTSQLHQSRLGLLSQALMMIVTVGFLFSETLENFWKTKVDLASRNTHDIIFRTVEIGVALWFPCVLWNCIRPEQLWCLNPKKILMRFPPRRESTNADKPGGDETVGGAMESAEEDDDRGPECWICYDAESTDKGPMINPCACKGDVGAVHHDCLKRWLVESADNPDALKCKVCSATYMVEKGSQFSLAQGFTLKQGLQTATLVLVMCSAMGGCWAVIQLYSEAWIRMLAVGSGLLVNYICLRFLGLNTVNAYQRAKVSALKIVNRKRKTNHISSNCNNNIPHFVGYNLRSGRFTPTPSHFGAQSPVELRG